MQDKDFPLSSEQLEAFAEVSSVCEGLAAEEYDVRPTATQLTYAGVRHAGESDKTGMRVKLAHTNTCSGTGSVCSRNWLKE